LLADNFTDGADVAILRSLFGDKGTQPDRSRGRADA
jgi:hypothetical protein